MIRNAPKAENGRVLVISNAPKAENGYVIPILREAAYTDPGYKPGSNWNEACF